MTAPAGLGAGFANGGDAFAGADGGGGGAAPATGGVALDSPWDNSWDSS
jgi:hypothetical protein